MPLLLADAAERMRAGDLEAAEATCLRGAAAAGLPVAAEWWQHAPIRVAVASGTTAAEVASRGDGAAGATGAEHAAPTPTPTRAALPLLATLISVWRRQGRPREAAPALVLLLGLRARGAGAGSGPRAAGAGLDTALLHMELARLQLALGDAASAAASVAAADADANADADACLSCPSRWRSVWWLPHLRAQPASLLACPCGDTLPLLVRAVRVRRVAKGRSTAGRSVRLLQW